MIPVIRYAEKTNSIMKAIRFLFCFFFFIWRRKHVKTAEFEQYRIHWDAPEVFSNIDAQSKIDFLIYFCLHFISLISSPNSFNFVDLWNELSNATAAQKKKIVAKHNWLLNENEMNRETKRTKKLKGIRTKYKYYSESVQIMILKFEIFCKLKWNSELLTWPAAISFIWMTENDHAVNVMTAYFEFILRIKIKCIIIHRVSHTHLFDKTRKDAIERNEKLQQQWIPNEIASKRNINIIPVSERERNNVWFNNLQILFFFIMCNAVIFGTRAEREHKKKKKIKIS